MSTAAPIPVARRLLPFVPYAAASALHVALLFAAHPLAAPTKLVLMPLLALAVVWASAPIRPWPRKSVILLLAAILASWLGDGAGALFPWAPELPLMLLFFGIAHLLYMWLFWRGAGIARRRRPPTWAFVYAAWWIVLVIVIGPHAGALLVPIMVYGLVLGGTAALASRCGPVIAWGGAWFLASDTILAFRLFLPGAMPGFTDGLVMLTYCLGQGLIAAGVVAALPRREARVRS